MKALYRKYRPTRLEDVVGQEQVTTPLLHALKQGKIGHAYLFIGPRGTGKTSVARIFAHAVNGFDYQIEDNYLDIIEIDAASNTGVDNIRELREKSIIAPSVGQYKVYIIDEVHMLSKSAANALLKTIEEPPAHVIFILATTEAQKVPITISSRTQLYNFRLASPETMVAHLRKIADTEKITIDDDALAIIARRGGGSFRDSLSLLDQIASLPEKRITAATINQALGLPEAQLITALLAAHAAGDADASQTLLRDLLNAGLSPETIAAELIDAIIAEPSDANLALLSTLTTVQAPFAIAKLLLALLDGHAPAKSVKPAQATALAAQVNTAPSQSAPKTTPAKPVAKTTPAKSAPKTTSEKPAKPAPKATPTPESKPKPQPTQPFAWEPYLERVAAAREAIACQLKKCDHEFDGQTLHLYPTQPFTAKVLKRSESSRILADALDGYALFVHDLGDHESPADPTLSAISAIMGDVRSLDDAAPDPF